MPDAIDGLSVEGLVVKFGGSLRWTTTPSGHRAAASPD